MAVALPLAHSGHWLVNLMYFLPVVVLGGAVLYVRIQNKRHPERWPDEDLLDDAGGAHPPG